MAVWSTRIDGNKLVWFFTVKHDEIKQLLKAAKNMLSNDDTISESLDIRKQYNLITEQGVVPTSGNITKKIDVGDAIEDEIENDLEKQKKSKRDKKQAFRISGGILVLHGKNQSELELTTDEKIAFQETMNEFVSEVSDLSEFNQLNVYPNTVEWSGKILEFNIEFMFLIGEENGIYIKGDMINTDDDFLEFIQKLKSYYEKFKSKWAKVLGSRKLTKLS
jgi:hypothetical protein